ncbi:ligand-binding sensor domain-containing protein [Flavobacterium arsenatis]|uniref:Ligand-binding sensor domain-containing protein n=1 Tax=Flavobacterium arsenatis TaxID=1484332 RepID=A0ABU1TTI6_9FLAO|nr:histidine kinase [Flavobacterium arsenatis]MDR6969191.1 ligand-binding sensor domain-containing protein [Flavobacterium arsenatis]
MFFRSLSILKIKTIKTILFGVFLFSILSTQAQEPLTRKISFLEGLPSEVIYDLFVDSDGLLYLGTDKGLITYDGVHFKHIKYKDNLGNSLNTIQEDEHGVIWCKNFANQLFMLQGEFLEEDPITKKLLFEEKANLVDFVVSGRQIWILTQKKIFTLKKGGKPRLIYTLKDEGSNDFLSMIYDKDSKKLYVTTSSKILTFKSNKLLSIESGKDGLKILELYKGLLCYNYRTINNECVVGRNQIELSSDLKNTYFNKLSDAGNNLWLCSNNGLYEIDVKNKKFKNGFLKGIRVTDIVNDQEGNSWISTLDEGLYLMPSKQILSFNFEASNEKSNKNYTKIAKGPNGNYFIGTSDGKVIEINKQGKEICIYDTKSDNTIEFISFSKNILLTTYGFFNIGNPIMFTDPIYFGKGIAEDDRGNFLMASSNFGGLISKSLTGMPNVEKPFSKYKTINYGKYDNKVLTFRDKRAKCVLFDRFERKYYVAYIDGLYTYDNFGVEKHIKLPDGKEIIGSEMLQDEDGCIWIATLQNGVVRLKQEEVVERITIKNGLSNNNCRRIEVDDRSLWIVTDDGFDIFDFKTKKVKNAALNLCIKGITINDVFVDDKTVGLATNQGVYYFNKNIIEDINLPKFRFTSILANGKKLNTSEDIVLKHNENNINIKFNTIHFKSLGNYNYEYRLKAYDDTWYFQPSTTKNINYLALNPGQYKFEIRVKLGDNYTETQEINFLIKKPFWLQYWFIAFSILLFLGLLFLVYRWAEIKTKKSQELKEQLALSQLTALRSQMNPHFLFNVLNSVQGLIYSNQKNKATDYLGKFSDLMRKILDSSDKNEVTIEKEFETIDLYVSLEKARFEDDFEYKISFPENVDLSQYKIPSMIIQPFVENAIKHGLMHKEGQKRLEIKAEILNDIWCFTIDDNGIGRKASEIINQKIKKHISFATKAIENRVKLINKTTDVTIDIETIDKKSKLEEPLGTRIKIYIPIIE